ncbi:MAG: EamA family transporter, partial [Anaerolineae bacterium]|nr:EamA family transporter [Anaerolineae bacterium]
TVLGLGLGFAGMALLVAPGGLGGGHVDPVGALVLIGGSFMWAVGSLYSRRARLPRSPLLGTAMEMLAGGALLLAASAVTGELSQFDPGRLSLRSLAACGYLLVFGSLIGFTAYIWLLRVVPATRVATYAYVNPVVAVFLGWALAGEPLSARTLLAAAVIVTAVVMVTTSRAPRQALPSAARLPESAEAELPGKGSAFERAC